MSEVRSADTDATVDVVHLSALMPESRPIAQLYTDSGTAVDQGAGHLERESGFSKLLQFRNRGATVKNLDILGTISARSIKPYAAVTSLSRKISATRYSENTIE